MDPLSLWMKCVTLTGIVLAVVAMNVPWNSDARVRVSIVIGAAGLTLMFANVQLASSTAALLVDGAYLAAAGLALALAWRARRTPQPHGIAA